MDDLKICFERRADGKYQIEMTGSQQETIELFYTAMNRSPEIRERIITACLIHCHEQNISLDILFQQHKKRGK